MRSDRQLTALEATPSHGLHHRRTMNWIMIACIATHPLIWRTMFGLDRRRTDVGAPNIVVLIKGASLAMLPPRAKVSLSRGFGDQLIKGADGLLKKFIGARKRVHLRPP